jgi:protein-S-isoprenylcysteine O-methyltransferase Ste14
VPFRVIVSFVGFLVLLGAAMSLAGGKIVRHPMYLSALFLCAGIPLALGSLWALIPAAAATLTLVVRTILEDRTLQKELAGYKDYAARVPHRLIPGVW